MTTKINLTLDQGADFLVSFNVASANGGYIDLTEYTGASQMRKHYTAANSTAFTVALTSDGNINLSLSAAATANIYPGRYLYDIELTDTANIVTRVIEGIVTVTPNMTR